MTAFPAPGHRRARSDQHRQDASGDRADGGAFLRPDRPAAAAIYEVRLGNDYAISGRLDTPGTVLVMSPKDHPGSSVRWWGGDSLMAAHKVQDRFYTFSASPTGDQLTVHPYRGDLGTFEIGPGGRAMNDMTVSGSLDGEERAVAVGGEVVDGSPQAARSCQLPVGDYRANFISVAFGRLAYCGVL